MAISDKTSKILWGRSGNRCAYCKCELVIDGTEHSDNAVIGDECHIVARNEKGPRGQNLLTPEQRDEYDNLILLCKIHHKMIDDQPETYTVDVLHKLKSDHETMVRNRTEPNQGIAQKLAVKRLQRISNAKDLVGMLSSSGSFFSDSPTPENETELQLLQSFFGEFEDILILADEPNYLLEATFRLKQIMKSLELHGCYIYGGKVAMKHTKDGTFAWHQAIISIKRFDVPEIVVAFDSQLSL